MGRFLRKGVLFTLLFAGLVAPASADPIVMLLMGLARQLAESQANKPATRAPDILPDTSRYYPGTTVEPEHLKSLIDDSFGYLSSDQRKEIFNSVNAALLDPKNAAVRGTMIEYFAKKALTVRAAQQRLANLSWQEKQRLANEFRQEVATLPAEDQAELGKLLRSGMLPVPGDFNQLLIAAFDAR